MTKTSPLENSQSIPNKAGLPILPLLTEQLNSYKFFIYPSHSYHVLLRLESAIAPQSKVQSKAADSTVE